MIVLGIDPGASGALAVVDGKARTAMWFDMPLEQREDGKRRVAAGGATLVLKMLLQTPDLIVIEDVHAMPKQGVTSSFHFGRALGLVEEAAAALGVSIIYVAPHVWKKAMGLSSSKTASRELAAKLFPSRAADFKLVKNDGRAEAVLLAEYGWRRHQLQERIK